LKDFPNNIKGVRLSSTINPDLFAAISATKADKVFFLFDENTLEYCMPLLNMNSDFSDSFRLTINSGEENKNLDQVKVVWDFFEENRAGRNSLLISVGGGMLTDLGGFAASTFKRGMSFINIPTTLLAMVDASVGGKTGINYHGLKNEIGVIREPNDVLIHAPFLESLDNENFKSGFAEMLKTGLIKDKELWSQLIQYDLDARNIPAIVPLIWKSVLIKRAIVDIDPEEKNHRRSLNFGHTIAHALESYSLLMEDHIHHGYAVAYGMIIEAHLSNICLDLQDEELDQIKQIVYSLYGTIPFARKDISKLIGFMKSDKKNDNDRINITMLEKIGQYSINNYVDEEMIGKVLLEVLGS
jgi:3-dehydroquinate synthase